MPGIARQFEPQITRTGGTPSQYHFTVQCSACHNAATFETNRPARDDQVKGYFNERGWLLGRNRSHDLCPACLAKPREGERHRGTETPRHSAAKTAWQPDREAASKSARHKDTADILARHLGRPEALAAEVFRPKAAQPQQPLPAPDATPERLTAPALSPEV